MKPKRCKTYELNLHIEGPNLKVVLIALRLLKGQ